MVSEFVLWSHFFCLIHEDKDMFHEKGVEQNSWSKVRALYRLNYPRRRWHRIPNAPTSSELSRPRTVCRNCVTKT